MTGPASDSAGGSVGPELDGQLLPFRPGAERLSAVPSWADGDAVLTVAGDIDLASADQLRVATRECLRRCPRRLALNLAAVTFCDVAGLRVLRAARQDAAAANAVFELIAPSPQVLRIFAVMEASDLLAAIRYELACHPAGDLRGSSDGYVPP